MTDTALLASTIASDFDGLAESPPAGGAVGLSLLALLCVSATGGVPAGFGYVCWWALRYGLGSNGMAGMLVAFSMASTLLSVAIPVAFGFVLYAEFAGAYRIGRQNERRAAMLREPILPGVFA